MKRIDLLGYPVLIGRGLLERAAELLGPILVGGRLFVVTDSNVKAAGWPEALPAIGEYVLPAGEENKSFSELQALLDALIEAGVERGDHVVAVGGGMVGDMAGFAAAILKRGCGFVQVPTSLLAQADAAIGSKTGINTRHGKNLVGAFHHPAAVLIDAATLRTLPDRELRCGYAEVVKYGLISDPDFFGWCEANAAALIDGDEFARLHAIERSVRAKAAAVSGDERDTLGKRALLNFGHTFAHALETLTGIPHGEAVALGMALAFRLSAERGLCPDGDARRVEAHLASVGLPTRLDGISPEGLLNHMLHDKKRSGGRLRLLLTRGIGEAFLDDSIEPDELQRFLERESAGFAVG